MQTEQTNEPAWQYNPEDSTLPNGAAEQPFQPAPSAPQAPATATVSWSASEFIAYHKPAGWYGAVVAVTFVLAGVTYLLTRDFFAVGTVVAMAVMFLIYANRKPRVLNYELSNKGVQIGSRLYPYGMFRSFAVIDQGGLRSITLMPLQRLKPPIDMYYDPQEEGRILDALSHYLPHEERQMDVVDKFLHRIKF